MGFITQRLDIFFRSIDELLLAWILRGFFPAMYYHGAYDLPHHMVNISRTPDTSAFVSSSLIGQNWTRELHFATALAKLLLADSLSPCRGRLSLTAWKILPKIKWAMNIWTITTHSTNSHWYLGIARPDVSLSLGSSRKLFRTWSSGYKYSSLPRHPSSIVSFLTGDGQWPLTLTRWTTPHCGEIELGSSQHHSCDR